MNENQTQNLPAIGRKEQVERSKTNISRKRQIKQSNTANTSEGGRYTAKLLSTDYSNQTRNIMNSINTDELDLPIESETTEDFQRKLLVKQ